MDTRLSSSVRIILFVALLALGICSRFIPHPPDATAVTAIIFAGALYLGPRLSIMLMLSTLLLSDAFIGGYELPVMLSVYGSYLLIGVVGIFFARSKGFGSRTLMLASASILFFLVTNAAVWLFTPWYAKDITGLMSSYALGLPFLKNMLIGDFLYTPVLLTALAFVLRSSRDRAPSAYAYQYR